MTFSILFKNSDEYRDWYVFQLKESIYKKASTKSYILRYCQRVTKENDDIPEEFLKEKSKFLIASKGYKFLTMLTKFSYFCSRFEPSI